MPSINEYILSIITLPILIEEICLIVNFHIILNPIHNILAQLIRSAVCRQGPFEDPYQGNPLLMAVDIGKQVPKCPFLVSVQEIPALLPSAGCPWPLHLPLVSLPFCVALRHRNGTAHQADRTRAHLSYSHCAGAGSRPPRPGNTRLLYGCRNRFFAFESDFWQDTPFQATSHTRPSPSRTVALRALAYSGHQEETGTRSALSSRFLATVT